MSAGAAIRTVSAEDAPRIRALLTAAFDGDAEAAIVDRLRRDNAVFIERVAELDGVIAGYICYSEVRAAPTVDGTLLGLGPLAVAPDRQSRGVGAALVNHTLGVCREHDARLIAVLGDPGYYARFGFEPAARRGMRFAGFDAGDAFRVIARDDIDADEIRTIHYHPAFDDED